MSALESLIARQQAELEAFLSGSPTAVLPGIPNQEIRTASTFQDHSYSRFSENTAYSKERKERSTTFQYHLNRSAPASSASHKSASPVRTSPCNSITLSPALASDHARSWRNRSIPLSSSGFSSSALNLSSYMRKTTSAQPNWLNRSAPASQPGYADIWKPQQTFIDQSKGNKSSPGTSLFLDQTATIKRRTVQPTSMALSVLESGVMEDERNFNITSDPTFENLVASTPSSKRQKFPEKPEAGKSFSESSLVSDQVSTNSMHRVHSHDVEPSPTALKTHESGVIDSERNFNISADVTFNNIVAPTPRSRPRSTLFPRTKRCHLSQSATLSALSFNCSSISEPVNLVLPKIEPKIENFSTESLTESVSSVLDLRIEKHNPTGIETSDIESMLKSESTEDPDKDPDWYPTPDLEDTTEDPDKDTDWYRTPDFEDTTEDPDKDPDWYPTPELEDTTDEDGDAELLNDLSIFEYMEKYQTIDSDSENDSDDELISRSKSSPKQDDNHLDTLEGIHVTSGDQSHHFPIPVEGGPSARPGLNITVHAIDDMAKECLEPKISKAKAKLLNKRRKEKGLEYTRPDRTVMSARKIRAPCDCRLKCRNKYSDAIRAKLLQKFLNLKLSGQNQFLAGHITVTKTARTMVINSRRTYSRLYRLPGVDGMVPVCKLMFMSTFDVGDRKIRNLAAKKIAGSGVAPDDGRSENTSSRTISSEHVQYVKNHILSFPAYTSHYSREKSDRLYLSGDLSISLMYQLYQSKCGTDGLIPVGYNSYRLIFKTMNLHFRKPKSDTCDECERFKVKLRMEPEDEEKVLLKKQQEDHQLAAQRVYLEKRKDVDRSKSNAGVRTVSFDLQKQLPTPFLRNGRSFYSRQLYTTNLTLFESYLGENKAFCYLWDESRARRGSQEVGSCLLKDLLQMPSTVEEVVYYSDRCAGQNQNKNIVFLFTHVLETFKKRGRSLRIHHKFMRTGHSHMEVDTVHAAIERAKKRTAVNIETPRDWFVFISAIRRSIPFEVIDMEQRNFLRTKDLRERYSIPKTTLAGEPFRFKNVMEFFYTTEHTEKVSFKYDVGEEQYQEIDLMTKKTSIVEEIELKPIETQPIALATAKLKDLRSLLPYITQKEYYETFLRTLSEPKRGRKPKQNDVEDHFDADVYDVSEPESS